MTLTEARKLLNSARAGTTDPTVVEITAALVLTGDVDADDHPLQVARPVGSWERSGFSGLFRPAEPFDFAGLSR